MLHKTEQYFFNLKRRIFFLLGICIALIIISYLTSFDLKLIYKGLVILILSIIFISIQALNKYESVLRVMTVTAILFINTISENIFVGNPIAYEYLGEDAGTIELYLYKDNQCKICYGGIFGVTDQFFGEYRIEGSNIRLDIANKLLDMKGRSIELNKQTYTIEQ